MSKWNIYLELVCMNNSRIRLKLKGSCLKQEDEATFTPKDLDTGFTLGGCLFGGAKLSRNSNSGRYSYSFYGIGFYTHIDHSLPDGSVGKNVIILRAHLCILIIKEKIS